MRRCKNLTNGVMVVYEDGEVVAAGTRDQMYSFVKHHFEDGEYLIIEGDEALKLSRSGGIVWPVATGKIEQRRNRRAFCKPARPEGLVPFCTPDWDTRLLVRLAPSFSSVGQSWARWPRGACGNCRENGWQEWACTVAACRTHT